METKEKKPCGQLNDSQVEYLARLIIGATERKYHLGTSRKDRIAAPSGAVILF